MAFVKLDCGILDSTLWPDRNAREIFITSLLMAEPFEILDDMQTIKIRSLDDGGYLVPKGWYGFVPAASTGIARRAGLEFESALDALERLASPEPESRTPDHEGRRMVRVDGGFLILNFDLYRRKDHTAAMRSKRYRERKFKSHTVTPVSHTVTPRSVTQAEGEAQADKDKRAAALSLTSLILEEWNRMASGCGLPNCLVLSDKRRRSLALRICDPFFCANWKSAMTRVSRSLFCRGSSDRGWRASFDWFISPDSVAKIMEGKYDGSGIETTNGKPVQKSLLEKMAENPNL